MAIYIEGNRKIKSIFANVNGTKKSISSVWVNKDGIPTKVFQLDRGTVDPYEVAPEGETNDWNYALDNENNIITLRQYINTTATDVIVYANYVVGGQTYKTQLASYGWDGNYNSVTYMFTDKQNIKTIKFSKYIDTSNVTNMGRMFRSCTSLTSLDVSNFDTSNVTDMHEMFNNVQSLMNLDISNFDTSYVTNMENMFNKCYALTSLDLSNFDTGKVKNMSQMFGNCRSLVNMDISNFDTSNVTNMAQMFYICDSLISLNLSSFDTNNVTRMGYMFGSCNNLEAIYVTNGKWSTSKADTKNMFNGCGVSSVTYI